MVVGAYDNPREIETGDTIDPTYLPAGSTAETATTIGALINGSAAATPNDTDFVATAESGGLLKKITWTNVKAFLKTYFDTLYYKANDTPTFTAINVGATDTTIARSAAGVLTVEGDLLYKANGTDITIADGGTGASTKAAAQTNLGIPVTLLASTTDAPTTGTTVETLYTLTIPAGTLNTDLQSLDIEIYGSSSNTPNSKTWAFEVNGAEYLSFTTTLRITSGWQMRGTLHRVSNTEIKGILNFQAGDIGGGVSFAIGYATDTGLNLSSSAFTIVFKGTTPTTAGNLRGRGYRAIVVPAP